MPPGLADNSYTHSHKTNHSHQPKANQSRMGNDALPVAEKIVLPRSSLYRLSRLRFVRQFAVPSTLCHRADGAKHMGQVLSSPGVNTTPACRA